MPKPTKAGKIPYEDIDQREYHRQYYQKNKELIRAKRMMAKETIVTEDVRLWKEEKLKDPYALYPFYDPSSNVRYGEEPDISIMDTPSSFSISIKSKEAL